MAEKKSLRRYPVTDFNTNSSRAYAKTIFTKSYIQHQTEYKTKIIYNNLINSTATKRRTRNHANQSTILLPATVAHTFFFSIFFFNTIQTVADSESQQV